ncbi:MAG TPA: DUF1361 domain-containing protein [Armatimonadota bacterium]|jgi:uncharacterized membrane protein
MNWDLSSWRWVSWNLFLALLPVAMAYALAWGVGRFTIERRRVPWIAWAPLALVWFAFLPNTCYLLTEWRHFLFDAPMPALIHEADTDRGLKLTIAAWGLFFLAYSGAGALCWVLGIRPIARTLRRALPNLLPIGAAFFFLASLGVYLGLVIRLNSWDLATRPGFVLATALQAVSKPHLLAVMIVFAALLWLLYLAGDIWVDGLMLRCHGATSRPANGEPVSALKP